MPVMPTRSSNAFAVLTASWPVRLSATSRISCGLVACLHVGDFAHQFFVDRRAAGGVEHDDVVAAEFGGIHGTVRDLNRRLARDDR